VSAFIAGFAAVLGLLAVSEKRYGTAMAAIVLLLANLAWLLKT
jgi:hypothetical protein